LAPFLPFVHGNDGGVPARARQQIVAPRRMERTHPRYSARENALGYPAVFLIDPTDVHA
jgi:hypothetical protein